MKVTILNAFGSGWCVDVSPEYSIEKLKLMALSHFYNPVDSVKSAHLYKLVHVNQGRPLSDDSSIRIERLDCNDELLLLKKRLHPHSLPENPEEKEQQMKGPSAETIKQATANVQPLNMDRKTDDVPVFVDFHTELRKILVSLIDVSEKLLRHQPEIQDIINTQVPPDEETVTVAPVDVVALQQLTDMGFPHDKSIRALRINKMSPVEAMDWLLAHNLDTAAQQSSSLNSSQELELKCIGSTSSITPASVEPASAAPPSGSLLNPPNKVARILKCFRMHKRKEFRPNRKAVNHLREMGFSENEIIDALRINGNNQDSACEWLLGERRPTAADLETGLDPEGPIYKAIMENPVIQLGLCNPKTFLAFLHMLENPSCTTRWLSDPDTTPILSQIFRIYHAEKHSLQLSRPFSQ